MRALHQVLHAFFNPHSFTLALPDVWAGFQVNLHMMFIAEALVLVLALMVAIVRGLTYTQAMRYVVVPQAVRRVIPPLLNDFVGLQKDTAIVSVIGVTEAASLAQQFSTQNGDFASYVVAAVFFILITIPLARFTDHLVADRERR